MSELSLLSRLPSIVWTTDRELRFTGVYGAGMERVSIRPGDIIGRTLPEYFAAFGVRDWSSPPLAAHRRVLDGESASFEYFWLNRSFHALVDPLHDEAGRVSGCIGTAVDVSDRVRPGGDRSAPESMFRLLAETLMAAVFLQQGDRFRYVNSAFERLTGYGRDELLGMSPTRLVGRGPQAPKPATAWPGSAEPSSPWRGEVPLLTKSGEERWAEMYSTPLTFEGGGALLGTAFDITERRRTEQALRASEARYRLLFERNLAGVYRKSLSGLILACNESFARMIGFDDARDLLSRSFLDLYADPAERELFLDRLRRDRALSSYEIRLRRADGSSFWSLQNVTFVDGEPPGIPFIEGTVIDITDRRLAEESMVRQAYYDGLTGLPNRTLFMDRVRHMLALCRRRGTSLAVLFGDLDGFKAVNDEHGHAAGDAVLRSVAGRLLGCVREGDTVARIGGDEFVILLPDVARPEESSRLIAQKVVDALREPIDVEGIPLSVGATLGIAIFPGDGSDAETLLKSADRAMYRAKGHGKGSIEAAQTPAVLTRPAGERSLAGALAMDEFRLFCEPVLRLRSPGESHDRELPFSGLEGQIRWRRGDGRVVPLEEILPLAEETGLIVPIGTWALWTGCRHASGFFADDPEVYLSIPLFGPHVAQGHVIPLLDRVLRRTSPDPRRLVFQISEKTIEQAGPTLPSILAAIRERGPAIALEGFWVGHSSFADLAGLPLDVLKLDFSLIGDIEAAASVPALRDAVHEGHRRGLRVVAQGIDTQSRLDLATRESCDEAQGPFLGRLLSADETRIRLRERRPPWAADQALAAGPLPSSSFRAAAASTGLEKR